MMDPTSAATRTIHLNEPWVDGNVVAFNWEVEPDSDLYRAHQFEIVFPESVDMDRIPPEVWLRVMLICLHPHWALLRPCKVILPRSLPHGEREFWMRMVDAAVATLESNHDGQPDDTFASRTTRTVEIVDSGPPLGVLPAVESTDLVATCFSGGRDSLTQLALLQELGETPLLVTTTSSREGSEEFKTARRRAVIDEIVSRREVELVEVESTFRGLVDNGVPAATRYFTSASEITDTYLYFAIAWATAYARGARGVYLASEGEVQESIRRDGLVVQHKHFMYAGAMQLALRGLIAPSGISHCGLTYPLLQFQVQRLLGRRYSELRDLQYSCWEQRPGEDVCSRCGECFTISVNLMSEGIAPREIGIDLNELLPAQSGWQPGGDPARRRSEVGKLSRRYTDERVIRFFRATDAAGVAEFLDEAGLSSDCERALQTLRTTAAAAADPPLEPGYRAEFLELIDERLRPGLKSIFEEHFEPEPTDNYEHLVENTKLLSQWITAPLRSARVAPDPEPANARTFERPQAPAPAAPTGGQLGDIAHLIPASEPAIGSANGSRFLPVADAALDGNELDYVTEAVESGWVSSAGPYVDRLEAQFADYCGTRFAVTTASGATALELMLRAAGIEPGDEVIMPTFTMVATANAVHHIGAKVVFVDSDPETWNMSLARVAEAIGPKTRAIIAMHTYGHPVDMDALREIADANSLALFEDAAEAHGATVRGRRVGSFGDAAAFSCYGNKIVTTGEGGIVTTDNPEIAQAARQLRSHAFSEDRHFWHRSRAFNFRMSNLQAALGLAQIERIDQFLEQRRNLARMYREHLGPIEGLSLQPDQPGMTSANWMFGVLVNDQFGCSRDRLRELLAADGIETRAFFTPLHIQPAYLDEFEGRRHPVAESMGRTGLYLPSALWLTDGDVERIAAVAAQAAELAAESTSSPKPA